MRRVNRSSDARLDSITRSWFDAAFERARRRVARVSENLPPRVFLARSRAHPPPRATSTCAARAVPTQRCDRLELGTSVYEQCYTAAKSRVSALAVTNGADRPSSLFIPFVVVVVVIVLEGFVDGFRLDETDIRRERREGVFVPGRLFGG